MPPGYNHPARVAERIATLDLVSNGRVEWGTGESASRAELEGFGIDPAERRAMWRETVEQVANMMAMDPAWSSATLGFPRRDQPGLNTRAMSARGRLHRARVDGGRGGAHGGGEGERDHGESALHLEPAAHHEGLSRIGGRRGVPASRRELPMHRSMVEPRQGQQRGEEGHLRQHQAPSKVPMAAAGEPKWTAQRAMPSGPAR